MVKVSVVIPVYDCIKYLKVTMESVGAQTFQDFEVILIDDACFDGSEKLAALYAKMDSRIRLIRHDHNLGVAESLNDGMVAATGDYIAIQHSDDVCLPQRLEREVEYLNTHPNVYLVAGWIQYIDENGKPKKRDGWWLRQVKKVQDDPEIIRQALLQMNCIPHTTVMFRKTIAGSVGFYDQDMVPAEDYDFWLRIAEKHDIGIIQEVLCQYRHHAAQISNLEGGQLMQDKAALAVRNAKKRRNIE